MNTAFSIRFATLLLGISVFVTPSAYAQTTGSNDGDTSTTQINEDVSQAIPVSSAVQNTAMFNNFLSTNACKSVSSSAANGKVTISTTDVLLNLVDPLGTTRAVTGAALNLYDCKRTAYEQISGIATSGVNLLLNIVLKYVLFVLAVMVSIGIWLLRLAAYIMTLMLGQGSFITNDLVRDAWPFVQGIANLGFIFALLYIAFATTLRLQSVSTSVQRLLPKLLIGALLVNFSLVIGGLLIDTSRLVMAAEFQLLGGGDAGVTIDNIAAKLLRTSDIYGNVFQENTAAVLGSNSANANPLFVTFKKSDSWSLVVEAIQALVFVYAAAIGMVVIALGLFWRYIMLLLLLIASPMAYVAVALPQTKRWFDQWWSSFLKWVTYGPIMLFILILIVRVQAIPAVEAINGDTRPSIYNGIIKLIVTVTLMLVAAKISSGSSGAFANSFMGMVNKTGAWARKNPKTALTLASAGTALPLVGAMAGAQQGATRSFRNVRDFSSNAIVKPWEKFTKTGSESIYDEKGNLKDGRTNFGSRQGVAFNDWRTGKGKKELNSIQSMQQKITNAGGNYDLDTANDAEFIGNLTQASFVAKLDKTTLEDILKNPNNETGAKAIAAAVTKNKDGALGKEQVEKLIGVVEKLPAAAQENKNAIISGISNNVPIVKSLGPKELGKVLSQTNNNKVTTNILRNLSAKS